MDYWFCHSSKSGSRERKLNLQETSLSIGSSNNDKKMLIWATVGSHQNHLTMSVKKHLPDWGREWG
jgi:hypothetical protein